MSAQIAPRRGGRPARWTARAARSSAVRGGRARAILCMTVYDIDAGYE